LAKHHVNLVITELIMPSMDGLGVMEMVKRRDPDVPVIVITASGTLEAAEEAVHQGADDFITKPFRKEQILVALERALEWQRVIRENHRLKSQMQAPEPEGKSS
jgi:DNA-binding NtrC family response regulator